MQILFEHKLRSRGQFGSNSIETYKVELSQLIKMSHIGEGRVIRL